MAIKAECPLCHKKQAVKNKVCGCGQDMDKAKKAKKVKYHITYRVNGSQKQEFVGYSIEEARDADGKRRVQKRENRIFEMLPEAKMTFSELTEWYLNIKSVKRLSSYDRVKSCLANFNEVFGNVVVGNIKPIDLENYQDKREEEGRAAATIDMELSVTQTMINKAFDNDMVNGRTIKAFRKVNNRLKKGANARDRELTIDEYLKLTEGKYAAKWTLRGKDKEEVRDISPPHLKPLLVVAFHTGMRKGEILGLKWSHIDRERGFIRLPAENTKEGKPKNIPINHHVDQVLTTLPLALHHDYVFMYKGQPIGKLRRSFESACRNAGIAYGRKVKNGLTFHDLRATFDTNMDRAGVSESCRKAILGHSFEGMDRHYLRLNDEDLKEAMDRYTAWIDDQISNVDQTVDQMGHEG